jgi:hypothetical protein
MNIRVKLKIINFASLSLKPALILISDLLYFKKTNIKINIIHLLIN